MKNSFLISIFGALIVTLAFAGNYVFDNSATSVVLNNMPSNLAVSVVSIDKNDGLAAVFSANSRTIKWITNDSSKNTKVNINLVKRVSGDPIQYDLVRTIVRNTDNDGQYSWNPYEGELGQGYYIEVTCGDNSNQGECVVSGNPIEVN